MRAVVEPARHDASWSVLGAAPPDAEHVLTLAIKQWNRKRLEDILNEVSSPDSPRRGKYLSYAEAHELTSNPTGTVAVLQWLESIGATVEFMQPHGHYVRARASISAWAHALDATFMSLVHADGGTPIVRALTDVTVPSELGAHIAGIFSATDLPHRKKRGRRSRTEETPKAEVEKKGPQDEDVVARTVDHGDKHAANGSALDASHEPMQQSEGVHAETDDSHSARRELGEPIGITGPSCNCGTINVVSNGGPLGAGPPKCVGTFWQTNRPSVGNMPVYQCYEGSGCTANTLIYYWSPYGQWICHNTIDNDAFITKVGTDCTGPYRGYVDSSWQTNVVTASCGPSNLPPFPPSPPPIPPGDVLGMVTPALVREYYHVPSNATGSGTTQAVFETYVSPHNTSVSQRDLTLFQSHLGLPIQTIHEFRLNGNITTEGVEYESLFNAADTFCQQASATCNEPNLDTQMLVGIATGATTQYSYWTQSYWADWILWVASEPEPPRVFSISYSSPESGQPSSVLEAFNLEAMKLGVQGVTLISCSMDQGVADATVANGNDLSAPCEYIPQFPASCPYVTAVGATQGPEVGKPEIVCSAGPTSLAYGQMPSSITSGGGFSNVFPTPSWQQAAVSSYLASSAGMSALPGYNATGRGYPDVAMAGNMCFTYIGGVVTPMDGTSCSTPIFASFVSLANAARAARREPSLGWLNPMLYQHGAAFTNDIVMGNNSCTEWNMVQGTAEDARCCPQGFSAAVGWDPASGLGSVRYDDFVATTDSLLPPPSPHSPPPLAPPLSLPTSPPSTPPPMPLSPLSPPSTPPPMPPLTPGASIAYEVVQTFTVASSIDDFNSTAFGIALANTVGVSPSAVTIIATAASVAVTATIEADTREDLSTLWTSLANLSSGGAAAASVALGVSLGAILPPVVNVETVVGPSPPPPAPPPPLPPTPPAHPPSLLPSTTPLTATLSATPLAAPPATQAISATPPATSPGMRATAIIGIAAPAGFVLAVVLLFAFCYYARRGQASMHSELLAEAKSRRRHQTPVVEVELRPQNGAR